MYYELQKIKFILFVVCTSFLHIFFSFSNALRLVKPKLEPNFKYFSVKYNGNGYDTGLVPAYQNKFMDGVSVEILGQGTMGKANLVFDVRTLRSNGRGPLYKLGEKIKIQGFDIELYANWVEAWKLIYHKDGSSSGNLDVEFQTAAIDKAILVLGPGTLNKDGYVFTGWKKTFPWDQQLDFDCSKVDYKIATKINYNEAQLKSRIIDLYPFWVKNNILGHKITYFPNGGFVQLPLDINEYCSGQVALIQSSELNLPGKTFMAWTKDSLNVGRLYLKDDLLIVGESSVNLYAKWKALFLVKYLKSEIDLLNITGQCPVDNNLCKFGNRVLVKDSNNLAKPNSEFIGWYKDIPDLGTKYKEDSFVLITNKGVTFYSAWRQSRGILYDPSFVNGTMPQDTKNYTIGETVNIQKAVNLIKNGYFLIGWSLKGASLNNWDKLNIDFELDSSFTYTKQLCLYAVWKKEYKVSYLNTEQTWYGMPSVISILPQDNQTYIVGDEIILKEAPQVSSIIGGSKGRDVYSKLFDGWTISKDANANILGKTFIAEDRDTIFYAKWKKAYKVKYNFPGFEEAKPKDDNVYALNDELSLYPPIGKVPIDGMGRIFYAWTMDAKGYGKPLVDKNGKNLLIISDKQSVDVGNNIKIINIYPFYSYPVRNEIKLDNFPEIKSISYYNKQNSCYLFFTSGPNINYSHQDFDLQGYEIFVKKVEQKGLNLKALL